MNEENQPPKKNSQSFDKIFGYIWEKRVAAISGLLMLVGIVLSFFFLRIGGILVGLAVGSTFFQEILDYFLSLREHYTGLGLFKSVMWVATVLYFLIATPAFILSVAIGFGAIYLLNWLTSR